MKLALALLVWTLIALAALWVLGPDTSRDLPKPNPPPNKPADHASVPSADDLHARALPVAMRFVAVPTAFCSKAPARRVYRTAVA